jgi:hypothetical protein
VRRQFAQTLGDAAVTIAMLGGGLWLMLDPGGTVGALSRWSDETALGTLAVGAQGSPASPGRALGADLGGVFAATVEAPWCYLEFGNVAWCREPRRLEPSLQAAGRKIAAGEVTLAACAEANGQCPSGATKMSLQASARLLREAQTNGALFLALAPNGPARNSINERSSLLRTLCRNGDATHCSGPGATEAEFRTDAGTWPRVTGLLLIAVGVAGMLLVYGYIAMRLLTAAVLGLFYLLLVPGVVLTPALGDRGRALFRSWAARLFGAVASKLVFAFLLGVLLTVTSVVERLDSLGWWAQWLLLSAFWWAAFLRRHQLLALPPAALVEARRRAAEHGLPGVRDTLLVRRYTIEQRERRQERRRTIAATDVEHSLQRGLPRQASPRSGHKHSAPARPRRAEGQARSMLEVEAATAGREAALAATALTRRAPRLARLERERRAASAAGDRRRAARLGVRRDRLARESAADEAVLATAAAGSAGRRRLARRERFLDVQAARPSASAHAGTGERRDYPALAALTGSSGTQYERLSPPAQRAARLEIDRQLALRLPPPLQPSYARDAVRQRTERAPGDPGTAPSVVRRSFGPEPPAAGESSMLRDAREVAAGRKRELGLGRE